MVERRTEFNTISERILYGLVFSYSDFQPNKLSDLESTYQLEWYTIMHNILIKVYKNPSLMNLPMNKDDYYKLHQCNNVKPELIKIYKKAMKVISSFYKFLYYSGLRGDIENDTLIVEREVFKKQKIIIKESFLELLKDEGLNYDKSKSHISFSSKKGSKVLDAWKLLSETVTSYDKAELERNNNLRELDLKLLKFACCVFSNDLSYWVRRVEKLNELNVGFFEKYEKVLLDKGYSKELDVEFNHNSLIISYKIKGEVSGISVSYHFHRVEQFYFSVLNCIGVKAILENFEQLDDNVKDYLMKSCRRCYGCNRCTKGGKNKRLTVSVIKNEKKVNLCPDFPNREWLTIQESDMETIIDYIDLQSKYGTHWKK